MFGLNLRNKKGLNIFGRRLDEDAIKKAGTVFFINLILATSCVTIMCALETVPLSDIMMEIFSAIGTVGISTGITRDITVVSKYILILLMYCGRIGSMSFALSFMEKKKSNPVQLPVERITIG